MLVDDDDDEMVIGDDEDDNPFGLEQTKSNDDEISTRIISFPAFFNPQVLVCNQLAPFFEASSRENTLSFKIPTHFLPSSLQMVCGFYLSPILIEVMLSFKEDNWNSPLSQISASHPIFNQNYVGRPLALDTIRRFFTNSYMPKRKYICADFILNKSQIKSLKYENHQLLFLIFELIDVFIDIKDHCCICHEPLPFSVIKPSICHKKLCEVGFNEIGVGSSVAQEIRRDVYAADLLFSIFACSFHNQKYMNPAPPPEILRNAERIFRSLPPMSTIAQNCTNDNEIIKKYGNDTLDLLRWVILSNKSQLIHLPEDLQLNSIGFSTQFMTLIASPQAEEAFQKKKKNNSNKSIYMWHGSGGDRWHSIIRNGLMNMSNKDCIHGASYGPGIYLAADASTSLGYSQPVQNLYSNSIFSSSLSLIALCEVVPVSQLKDFGGIATLQDEEAIIVRFIFPTTTQNGNIGYPQHNFGINRRSGHFRNKGFVSQNINEDQIPKLQDVLKYLERESMKNNRKLH